tara:strand:- start:5141 stop:5764 length:624 start_codon:yes stop_codon:yes gene_type:complete
MNLLIFIFGKKILKLFSFFIKLILILKGFKIGKNFYIEAIPKLKLNSTKVDIVFGDNVKILGTIDLRTRETGSIFFDDNVVIEDNCRFVSARTGKIKIGNNTIVTTGAILNGGADLIIGKNCVFGPRNTLNANEHNFKIDQNVNEQGYTHQSIMIGNDCWFGANVVVAKGVTISDKSIIGANSFVNKSTEKNSINAGSPAKQIGVRE